MKDEQKETPKEVTAIRVIEKQAQRKLGDAPDTYCFFREEFCQDWKGKGEE